MESADVCFSDTVIDDPDFTIKSHADGVVIFALTVGVLLANDDQSPHACQDFFSNERSLYSEYASVIGPLTSTKS